MTEPNISTYTNTFCHYKNNSSLCFYIYPKHAVLKEKSVIMKSSHVVHLKLLPDI